MIGLFFTVAMLSVWTPAEQQEFQFALDAYWKSDYPEAIKRFESITEKSPTASAVWYNYGTALSAAGKTGMAVYALERALLLSPRDPDVLQNLSITKVKAIEAFSATEQETKVVLPALERGGESLFRRYQNATLNWAFSGCWLLFFIALWFAREGRKPRLRTMGFFFSLVFFLLSAGVATLKLGRAYWIDQTRTGIVIDEMGIARQGPGVQYRQQARILGGAKVKVLGEQAPWVLIEYTNGRTAWLEQASILELPNAP